MSDIFKRSIQKPKRDFGDWLFDNFGWIILGGFVAFVISTATLAYFLTSHSHEIAREVGGIARSAADGFNKPAK